MEKTIIKTAANIFKTSQDQIKIEYRLIGGMSNYTYVISYLNEKYTIRLVGDGGEVFVDRQAEQFNLDLATKLNLVNETVYFSVESGIKISKYIPGSYLTNENINQYLSQVADILRKVHQSDFKAYSDFDPIKRIKKYQELSQDYNLEYEIIKLWWQQIYVEKYQNLKFSLTHGDCQRSNFVIGRDQLYLLDWEYCGNNDPLYDVSVFGQNNFKDALDLLPIYLQRKPTEEEIFRIRFYRIQQTLMWYHVALYKDNIGLSQKLNLDFQKIAQNYWLETKYHYELLKGEK